MRRLLIDPQRLELAEGELRLEAAEVHYLLRVLRLGPGDRFALVDGAGRLWTAELAKAPHLAEPLRERRGRAKGEEPLVAVLEHFFHGGCGACHHRAAGGHGFEQAPAQHKWHREIEVGLGVG